MDKVQGIRHLWFDFTDTIAAMDKTAFDDLIYSAYSEVVKKPVTDELVNEYKEQLGRHKSNSAIFTSLGMRAGYLSDKAQDRSGLYHLTDPHVPKVIAQLKDLLPVSIFSNSRLDATLPTLDIQLGWFTHILGPDVVKNPKPALDGFHKMVELSNVPAEAILYIGDDVEKDLVPAKQVGMQTGLLWKESQEADYCFKDFSHILESFKVS
ncbi:MAG TPA: HAD family hydrolase [Candidatus Paceibacterota bacterium]